MLPVCWLGDAFRRLRVIPASERPRSAGTHPHQRAGPMTAPTSLTDNPVSPSVHTFDIDEQQHHPRHPPRRPLPDSRRRSPRKSSARLTSRWHPAEIDPKAPLVRRRPRPRLDRHPGSGVARVAQVRLPAARQRREQRADFRVRSKAWPTTSPRTGPSDRQAARCACWRWSLAARRDAWRWLTSVRAADCLRCSRWPLH